MSAINETLPARASLAIDVSGGDQTVSIQSRAIHVNGAGDIVGRLVADTADRTFTVAAGCLYPYKFSVIRQTGTTATGLLLF